LEAPEKTHNSQLTEKQKNSSRSPSKRGTKGDSGLNIQIRA